MRREFVVIGGVGRHVTVGNQSGAVQVGPGAPNSNKSIMCFPKRFGEDINLAMFSNTYSYNQFPYLGRHLGV
jgi:hypothetical protein